MLKQLKRHLTPREALFIIIPQPTARSAIPGVNPGRGLLIPLGYLHPGKCQHSKVQSHPPLCNGRSTLYGFLRYAHARVTTDFKNMAEFKS